MQEFYRIENGLGDGFYRSKNIMSSYCCFPDNRDNSHSREFHPNPFLDKIEFTHEHIFGFQSVEQLKRWFYRDYVRKIKSVIDTNNTFLYLSLGNPIPFEANLFVIKYLVDERRDGIRQSVAIKKDLIQIGAVPFEIFFKEFLTIEEECDTICA